MSRPKQSNRDEEAFAWQPVGIAVGGLGVDLRTAPQNRQVEALAELTNATFVDDRTIGRRAGHTGFQLRDSSPASVLAGAGYTRDTDAWLFGAGSLTTDAAGNPWSLTTRYHNRGGGVCTRDGETLAWTGDRLLSIGQDTGDGYGSDYWALQSSDKYPYGVRAWLPSMSSFRVSTAEADDYASTPFWDAALGTTSVCVAYTSGGEVRVSIYDRATGAPIHSQSVYTIALGYSTTENVRVIYSAGMFVVYWRDSDLGVLRRTHASESNPQSWATTSTAGNCEGPFDLAYVNRDTHLVAWSDGNTDLLFSYYSGVTALTAPAPSGTQFPRTTYTGVATALSVAVHRDGTIGLIWQEDTPLVAAQTYTAAGAALGTEDLLHASGSEFDPGVAIAPRFHVANTALSSKSRFRVYCNVDDGTAIQGRHVVEGSLTTAGASSTNTHYNALLCSKAFRCGDKVAVWMVALRGPRETSLATTEVAHPVGPVRFLSIEDKVVGYADQGTVKIENYAVGALSVPAYSPCQPSVWPDPLEGYPDDTTPRHWVTVTGSVGAVAGIGSDGTALNVRLLDLTPPLRWAQFGKSTYFAGACLQAYDGQTVDEVGFPYAPYATGVAANPGGAGTDLGAGTYTYRVYLTWLSEQGEVFRSPCQTTEPITVVAPNDVINLTIYSMAAVGKRNCRFEIYRNEGETDGTTYYLVGVSNVHDRGVATVTYTDGRADADIRNEKVDPFNPAVGSSTAVLETLSPPASEVLCVAGDRLWLGGGDIPPGMLVFSKQWEIAAGAGFSDQVGSVMVDPAGRPVRSLACLSDAVVIFTDQRPLVLGGNGPDTYGAGFFPPASVLAGPGAVTHEGTCTVEPGIVYWSAKGPRLLTTGFSVSDISAQVEPLARNLRPSACVSPAGLREVRWYTADGTALLWDYTAGRWSVWSGLRVTGAACQPGERPWLVSPSGRVLREDPDAASDAGSRFEFVWRMSGIRLSELLMGKNLVRRIGLTGQYHGPHTLKVWVYYDGSPMWEQRIPWTPTSDINFGLPWDADDTAWDAATAEFNSPDAVYRMSTRVTRQTMSSISIRVSDGAPPNKSYTPHELSVEIGPQTGLTPMPQRTFG